VRRSRPSASGCEDATEIAFSPKGDVIALGTSASVVCTFDRATNELLRSWTASKPADPAVDTPVGILEFAGGGDGLVVGHLDYPGWSGAAALYRASGELLADLGQTLTGDVRHDASGALILSCARVSRDLEVRRPDLDGTPWQPVVAPTADTAPSSRARWSVGAGAPARR
jgi:hypothetical protein